MLPGLNIFLLIAKDLFLNEKRRIIFFEKVQNLPTKKQEGKMNHGEHGRTDDDGTPLDPDCCCRGNPEGYECAAQGCGFCRCWIASELREHFKLNANCKEELQDTMDGA